MVGIGRFDRLSLHLDLKGVGQKPFRTLIMSLRRYVPRPDDRTIDAVSMVPAFSGKPIARTVPLFWRTHVSPPGDRVALRIGDWKLVGNDTLSKFQLYEIERDWKEQNDLAAAMPEKTEAMKKKLFAIWKSIEAEGPDHWWKAERQKPAREGKLNY